MNLLLIFFNIFLLNADSNLKITMKVEDADDCITEVYIDNSLKYTKPESLPCWWNQQKNHYIINSLPYVKDKVVKIILKDLAGEWNEAGISITVFLNEFIIKTESKKFWKCENCLTGDQNYVYDYSKNRLDCFEGCINANHIFSFIFKIDPFSELSDSYDGYSISRFPYYLAGPKYFFKHITNLEDPIDLINNLNSVHFICAKNGSQVIEPIYELINFRIYFDNYFPSSYFKILSIDKNNNNNEIILNPGAIYNIQINNVLKYKLQEKEKMKKGVHIKFKIRILDLQKNPTTIFEEFNFFICLNEYQICDVDTYMKCLNEGFYKLGDFYYSCYETCKTCDVFKKPDEANYINNYCDSCKDEYPFL